jgi:hypothetical protein
LKVSFPGPCPVCARADGTRVPAYSTTAAAAPAFKNPRRLIASARMSPKYGFSLVFGASWAQALPQRYAHVIDERPPLCWTIGSAVEISDECQCTVIPPCSSLPSDAESLTRAGSACTRAGRGGRRRGRLGKPNSPVCPDEAPVNRLRGCGVVAAQALGDLSVGAPADQRIPSPGESVRIIGRVPAGLQSAEHWSSLGKYRFAATGSGHALSCGCVEGGRP